MGRPRKAGKRYKNGQLKRPGTQSARDMLVEENGRVPPPDWVLERRKLWAFVTPTKGPDGRTGEIDQDICDALGQLHALGLLDNPYADSTEMRDKGRRWGTHYAMLLRASGFKGGGYERMDKAMREMRLTKADLIFDVMDEAVTGFERSCLLSLIVDPIVGSFVDGRPNAPWVEAIINEGLLAKGKIVPMIRFPDSYDRSKLEACVRGLIWLVGQKVERIAA